MLSIIYDGRWVTNNSTGALRIHTQATRQSFSGFLVFRSKTFFLFFFLLFSDRLSPENARYQGNNVPWCLQACLYFGAQLQSVNQIYTSDS